MECCKIVFRCYWTEPSPDGSLLAEVAGDIRLPESVQVEEAFSQAFGSRLIGVAAAIGQGVAAAQTQSVHLWVRSQPGLFPAENRGDRVGGKGLGDFS